MVNEDARYATALGKRIQTAREDAELTRQDVVRALKLNTTALHYWESGKGSPRAHQIARLSYLFGVSTDYLLLGHDK